MFTLVGPSVAALAVGLLFRGSLRGLARTVVGWPAVALAFVVEFLLATSRHSDWSWLAVSGHWIWAGSLAAMLPVLLLNARRASGLSRLPWLVASLGLSLNLSVIFANGGYMPLDVGAVEETHQSDWFAKSDTLPAGRADHR